jgi:serine/threonine protein kinase
MERFRREVEALRRPSSDHLVECSTWGQEESGGRTYHWLAMPYFEGNTLTKELAAAGGVLPPARARLIVGGIALGLQALHDLRIVHRDVKPDNIFITSNSTTLRRATRDDSLVPKCPQGPRLCGLDMTRAYRAEPGSRAPLGTPHRRRVPPAANAQNRWTPRSRPSLADQLVRDALDHAARDGEADARRLRVAELRVQAGEGGDSDDAAGQVDQRSA